MFVRIGVPTLWAVAALALFARDPELSAYFFPQGLSGPAALQLSSFWAAGTDIHIDLLPGQDAANVLLTAKAAQPGALLRTVLSELLPRALVLELQPLFWAEHAEAPLNQISDAVLLALALQLHDWSLRPAGTEGYRTAEVTLGGIDTDELSSKTMECKRQPGLFCIGEVVDVSGHLGGFNFQWAWSSAQAAAKVV